MDQRFILNLKLTHQIMSNLSEHLDPSVGASRNALGGDGEEGGGKGREESSGKIIVEIGPGPGALTRSLLTREAVGVLGIEVDHRFNSYLEQIHQQTDGKFRWVNADIMRSDEYALIKEHFSRYVARMEGDEEGGSNGEEEELEDDTRVDGGDFFGSAKASPSPRANTVLKNGFHVPLKSTHRESILKRRQHLAFGTGLHSSKLSAKKQESGSHSEAEDDFFSSDSSRRSAASKARKELSEEERITARWNSTAGSSLVVVSNLPFALTTGLLMRYSFDAYNKQGIYKFGRTPVFCLLPQLIANRLIALPPGTRTRQRVSTSASPDAAVNDEYLLAKSYGRPSVLFQNYFHVRVHRLFSEKTFYPPVDILGGFVQLTPRAKPLVDIEPATLIAFLDTAFMGVVRSRAVGAALRQAMPAELISFALQQLRIDSAVTMGQLSVREVCLLAKVWERYMLGTNQSMKEASQKAKEASRREREKQWEAEAAAAEEEELKRQAAAASAAQQQEGEEEGATGASKAAEEREQSGASFAEEEGDTLLLDIMFQGVEENNSDVADKKRADGAEEEEGDDESTSTSKQNDHDTGLFIRKGKGGEEAPIPPPSNLSPNEALIADAMEFFGYDDYADGDEAFADDSSIETTEKLKTMLKNAQMSGKDEYLRFKKEMEEDEK